jgi:Cu2+-exporting ATPase
MTPEAKQHRVFTPVWQRIWMALLALLVLAFVLLSVFGLPAQWVACVFVAALLVGLGRKAFTVGDGWAKVNADRSFFEVFKALDVFVIAKTETLTKGKRTVALVESVDGMTTPAELLALVAAVEFGSDHPIAKAIIKRSASDKTIEPYVARDQRAIPGVGVTAMVDGQSITIAGPSILAARNLTLTVDQLMKVNAENIAGRTVVYALRNSELLGFVSLDDEFDESVGTAIRLIQRLGKRVVLLSSDAQGVVELVANRFGVDQSFAEILPHLRPRVFEQLSQKGERLALVGNEFAPESDGLVQIAPDLATLRLGLDRGVKIRRVLRQNLLIAAVLELAALPLALGALAGAGWVFEVVVGSVLISLSTAIAVLQARSMKR